MSEKSRAKKNLAAERRRARKTVGHIQSQLDCAWSAFDNITDPNLMDANIFEISALQSRYNCAVRDLKALYPQEG
jgi:hypothetical protein